MKKKYLIVMLFLSGFPFYAMLAQDSVRVAFTGMNPHLDQELVFYLRDTVSGETLDTVVVNPVVAADFTLASGPIQAGGGYYLDFYADYNENGEYDVPPTDHAWRIVLDNTDGEGDTVVNFAHNTDFTDITWEPEDTLLMITVNFVSMNPHLNQDFFLYLRNMDDGTILDSLELQVDMADFQVVFDSVSAGDYNLDFYADHNQNGMYDAPADDHAWRIELAGFNSDTTLEFVHNTDFTDIFPEDGDQEIHQITISFISMDPHLGQDLYLYLRNAVGGEFVDSLIISPVDAADFDAVFDSVPGGSDYNLDFYADLNENGVYDAPPADHAWRIELPSFDSDTTLEFVHNTDFTDIFPADGGEDIYMLTISFVGMDPHLDQNLILYLRDPVSGDFVDSVKVEPVSEADFEVVFDSVAANTDYNLDFYADLNQNDAYDVPPADHAWRILLSGISADTTIEFVHNTEFTDIGLGVPTSVEDFEELGYSAYPNPVKNELNVVLKNAASNLSVYNVAGARLLYRTLNQADRLVRLNLSTLKPGVYILRVNSGSGTGQFKFLKE